MSKMQKIRLATLLFVLFAINATAQYKSFKISATGDTINIVDKKV
jgi:hypothetical protein